MTPERPLEPEPALPVTPPAALKARLLSTVREQPAPTRTAARLTAALVAFASAAWVLALFFRKRGLVLGHRPWGYVLFIGLGWLFLAAVTSALSSRGRSMLGRPRRWLGTAAGLTTPLLFAWALLGNLAWPETTALTCPLGETICCEYTLLMGLGPLLGMFLLRRRSDPLHPRLTGAALGAAAGAWGSLAMAMHCPFTAPLHVLVGHVLPAALLALLGGCAGPFVLAVRRPT